MKLVIKLGLFLVISIFVSTLWIMLVTGESLSYNYLYYLYEISIITLLFFSGLVFLFYLKPIWNKFKRLHISLKIVVLYLISLIVALIRDFIDSGYRFSIDKWTFYDSIFAFVILLVSILIMRRDLNDMTWERFRRMGWFLRLLAVIALGFVLWIIYIMILVRFFGLKVIW